MVTRTRSAATLIDPKFVLRPHWSLYRTSPKPFPLHDLIIFFSLGNSAIFLIGGLTRSIEPVPILLRSGDIVVMSGPGCRRAYHGEIRH